MSAGTDHGPAGAGAVAHVFVDALDDRCEISGDDGHHLQRVRRITAGERVTAADGSGAWRTYEVIDVSPRRLLLGSVEAARQVLEPDPAISLAVALTKGGLDDVVAAVTELGVVRITPVRTERVVVRWDGERAARAVARLRTVAREAAMQSRRARIPVVDDVVALAELADRPGLVIAEPGGVAARGLPPPRVVDGRRVRSVLVGPEGGLSTAELDPFAAAPRLGLGPNVLRASTAPVAAVAVLAQEGLLGAT